MGHKKITSVLAVLALTLLMVPAFVLAAEPPPTTGTIEGPEVWGVVVINCDTGAATLRVKRVVDCNVETEVEFRTGVDCTALTETYVLYQALPGGSLFGDPREPILTKVKNFKKEADAVSFDAQIKFYTP